MGDRKSILFNKFYQDTATKAERNELFLLLNVTTDAELEALMAQEWQANSRAASILSENENQQIINAVLAKNAPNRRIGFKTIISIAAMLVVMLTVGLYLSKKTNNSKAILAGKRLKLDFSPAKKIAKLILSNGKELFLGDSANRTIFYDELCINAQVKDGEIVYHSIANPNALTATQLTNTIQTPSGGHYKVILPDGTKVWLNASSTLKFPAQFAKNERRVKVIGEAYFEVTENKLKPFLVDFNDAEIKVLGTHFNVRAYPAEKQGYATLVSGSIKLSNSKQTVILRPKQKATLFKETPIAVKNMHNVEQVVAWKNNYFEFQDAEIKTVMNEISRWYNVKVIYEDQNIPKTAINGKISRDVKLSELLNMLSYTGIEFKISANTITIK